MDLHLLVVIGLETSDGIVGVVGGRRGDGEAWRDLLRWLDLGLEWRGVG